MFESLRLLYKGKVRDVWQVGEDHGLIYTTDRISVFDHILPTPIPGRGEILTKITRFWAYNTDWIVPNHIKRARIGLDTALPNHDERPNACKACQVVRLYKPLPIEAIVRGYIFGSLWNAYTSKAPMDVSLPASLRLAEKLPRPVFTPTTKAPIGEHDEPITFETMCEMVGEKNAIAIKAASFELYRFASEYALERGIIIADTKFEFALDEYGQIVLIDEILTPDSSRFWDLNEYEVGKEPPSFDKQIVRDYVKNECVPKGELTPILPDHIVQRTFDRYKEVYNRLTQ